MDDLKMERPTYASLSTPPRPAPEPAKRSGLPWIIAVAFFAFALGLIANPWFEREVRSRLPGFQEPAAPSTNAVAIAALQARIAQLEAREPAAAAPPAATIGDPVEAPDETDQKLAEINEGLAGVAAKVDATAERADEALTNASAGVERAQTLLLVSSVRRTIDIGARLGVLAPALYSAFPAKKAAVDAVVAAGARPVTLAKLRADLAKHAPTRPAASDGWWGSMRANMGNLIEIRRADAPARPQASGYTLAVQRLSANDVAGAIAALGADADPVWLADARRYLAAQRGLAQLEAATVAKP